MSTFALMLLWLFGGQERIVYPSTKRTTGLPVGELILWRGMFAPKGSLEWYYGFALYHLLQGLPVGLHKANLRHFQGSHHPLGIQDPSLLLGMLISIFSIHEPAQ